MSPQPEFTEDAAAVLAALLQSDEGMWFPEIRQATGLPTGAVHHALVQWMSYGVVHAHWKTLPPTRGLRPFFTFTPMGRYYAAEALNACE